MINDENFQKALKFVRPAEGGYVNNPDDKGGPTNKGVTQKVYDEYRRVKKLKTQSVQYITDDEATDIFYKNYWLKAGCHKMSYTFAVLCFDTAINNGIGVIDDFLKASEYKNPYKYLLVRIFYYLHIANNHSNQRQFLRGWLNRMEDLTNFLKL